MLLAWLGLLIPQGLGPLPWALLRACSSSFSSNQAQLPSQTTSGQAKVSKRALSQAQLALQTASRLQQALGVREQPRPGSTWTLPMPLGASLALAGRPDMRHPQQLLQLEHRSPAWTSTGWPLRKGSILQLQPRAGQTALTGPLQQLQVEARQRSRPQGPGLSRAPTPAAGRAALGSPRTGWSA